MSASSYTAVTARAIVTHEPVEGQASWKLEEVTLRALEPTELLVRIISTGICHTDILFSTWPKEAIPYPRVLGHEGESTVPNALSIQCVNR